MSTTADGQAATVDVHTLGGTFDEAAVDQWELAAAQRALKNLKAVASGQVMVDLLADQIEAGDQHVKELLAASDGTYRESRTEFTVRGLTGTGLAEWFQSQWRKSQADADFDNKTLFFNAHPEHYGAPPHYRGGNVEMIGGHLIRFKAVALSELPVEVRSFYAPEYPVPLMNALLTLDDDTPFAYCVHQARDTETGSDVVVRVLYPSAAPDSLIEGHCRHLAIEFRTWIRSAAAGR
ncbi:hypothetical protein [Amycolatopsis jejuensis]|uniref:hypothetical protein n=1 Tax=Amycolatopsis jejuensis TaxID=330084 RepID=UPI00052759EB|nr:hypothetical protein [Amycolatopsis jejuensis]